MGSKINVANNCLKPATNHGGMVSTPILIPKNVVPQTTATMQIAIIVLELKIVLKKQELKPFQKFMV